MLALDTSGKISQFPIIVAVSKADKSKIIDELRDRIRKRHKGLASRRRIKSSDLTDNELEWFISRIDFPFKVVECDALQYRTFKSLYQQRKKWKFEFLTLAYYSAIIGLVKNKEGILLDQDYDQKSMEFVIKKLKELLKNLNKIEVKIKIAEQGNEWVCLADLIAGSARRGLVSSTKPNLIETALKYFKK